MTGAVLFAAGVCSVFRAHAPASSTSAAAAATAATIRRDNMGSSGGGCDLGGADPRAQLVATAAARLVEVGAADHHAPGALLLAIGAVGGRSAYHADRQRLGDVLGNREQLRHGLERAPGVVLVEAGYDHALAAPRQPLHHLDQVRPQELPLVDPDHLRLVSVAQDVLRLPDRARGDAQLAVGDDVVPGVAVIDHRLEDLDPLAGDLGAPEAADQLLGLAAVHAANDDFDPARRGQAVRRGFGHGARRIANAMREANRRAPSRATPRCRPMAA